MNFFQSCWFLKLALLSCHPELQANNSLYDLPLALVRYHWALILTNQGSEL